MAEGTLFQERQERQKERSENHHFGSFGTDTDYDQIVKVPLRSVGLSLATLKWSWFPLAMSSG